MRIEHAAIFVSDIEAAKDFFCTFFGGRAGIEYFNKDSGFRSYFISFDDGARLEVMSKPGVKPIDRLTETEGYSHAAFSVGSKEAVDELTEKLSDAGYEVISGPRTTGDGYYESCIFGIDNIRIEITV